MRTAIIFVLLASVARSATAAPSIGMADLSGMFLSLVLVLAFIVAAAWVVRRTSLGMGRGSGPLKVLAALPLGPKERLLLVEARGEEVLIAVSPAGVFNVGAAVPKDGAGRALAVTPTFSLADPS